MFKTTLGAIKENNKLEQAIKELSDLTPPPMNTMLEKQPRSEAIIKKKARESMPFVDVPPTNPGNIKQNWEIKALGIE